MYYQDKPEGGANDTIDGKKTVYSGPHLDSAWARLLNSDFASCSQVFRCY